MEGYKDPTRLTRAAIVAVSAWLASSLLWALLQFVGSGPGGAAGMVAIVRFPILLACWVVVGMWIYRTNANAHAMGGDVSVTPGWAVGWFAVPIANLFMPYQAMRDTWEASHEVVGLDGEKGLPLLRWWWGLWLVSGAVGYISFFLTDPGLGGAVSYPLCLDALLQAVLSSVFIRLMQRLANVQTTSHPAHVFA